MSIETLLPQNSMPSRTLPEPAVAGTGGHPGAHVHGGSAAARAPRGTRVGPSVLRLSLAARLALAVALLLPLWVAVALVVGRTVGG
ncbi:hypothetical protein V5F44_17170 [Xanthobacter sp. V2C-8]|uniref:hypothetical protein n=1 Tax=Xanthobacter albus TaxID=3119929 RepID=UPI00372BDACB